jgi:hypothetical protein
MESDSIIYQREVRNSLAIISIISSTFFPSATPFYLPTTYAFFIPAYVCRGNEEDDPPIQL